jgi:hypothetical protein
MAIFQPPAERIQMSGMTAFVIAVGGTSLICFLLMNRVQSRSARRSPAGDSSADGASYDSGGGWYGVRRRQFHFRPFGPIG